MKMMKYLTYLVLVTGLLPTILILRLIIRKVRAILYFRYSLNYDIILEVVVIKHDLVGLYILCKVVYFSFHSNGS